MSRSLATLVLLLALVFSLLVWLMTDERSVLAESASPASPQGRSVRSEPARTKSALLSQLARTRGGGSGEHSRESVDPRSASGLGERPDLLDVPMDWSLPHGEWWSRVKVLEDDQVIAGLRDDTVKWNAITSAGVLRDRLRAPGWASATRQRLERAFESPGADSQLKRLSAGLLQAHAISGNSHDPHEPGDALIEYSVSLLRKGVSWRGEHAMAGSVSGRQSLAFGLEHIDRMAPLIARDLGEVGAERAFAHAFLLGKSGSAEFVHLAAPILVDHLRDNDQDEDALMSMEALLALGDKAEPWLWSTLRAGDAQQEHCIRLLLEEMGELEPAPERERGEPLSEPLTWKFENPTGAWRFLENSAR